MNDSKRDEIEIKKEFVAALDAAMEQFLYSPAFDLLSPEEALDHWDKIVVAVHDRVDPPPWPPAKMPQLPKLRHCPTPPEAAPMSLTTPIKRTESADSSDLEENEPSFEVHSRRRPTLH